jgi:EAL domain-containing protein (putative c-di-GMP-specific phosphodiesterase class I)
MFAPVSRYHCEHYRCEWKGLSVYLPERVAQVADLKLQKGMHPGSSQPIAQSRAQPIPPEPKQPQESQDIGLQPDRLLVTSTAPEASSLEISLQRSLDQNQFVVHYQPKFNLETKDITGMEALLRWHHPKSGFIAPAQFIPLVEEHNLIVTIGQWMLKKVCLQGKEWQEKGLYPLAISVNLSAKEFYQPNLVSMLQGILSETGFEPQLLELEMAEQTVMLNVEVAQKVLEDLRSTGIQVAIDDFGTGNSSLRDLRRFSIDTIKIDPSLIHGLQSGSKQATGVIQSFLLLAKGLNCKVVAEGVETSEQLQILRLLGCEAAQGYLFDHPLTVEDAMDVLQANWLGRRTAQN